MIFGDKGAKSTIDHVKYPFIHCLNTYGKNSLYFKSRSVGYCLLFQESDPSKKEKKGAQCYKNLLLMLEQKSRSGEKETIGEP